MMNLNPAQHSRARHVRAVAGALAILCGTTGCARGAASASSGGPPGMPRPATVSAGRGTPGTAFTHWMGDVVRGDFAAACRDMGSPSACTSRSPKALAAFRALHGNFTADGIAPRAAITVAHVHVTGTRATIDGTNIHIAGTTLTSLMVKHSTGLKRGQLSISFELSRSHNAWYVTSMNLNVG
jgi:hypothetical protein